MAPQTTARRADAGTRTGPGPRRVPVRTESVLAVLGILGLALVLVALAALGSPYHFVALGVAALTCLIAVIGRERTAIAVLMGAYATAPMYKGLAPSADSIVTATDGLVALGFLILAPSLFGRRIVMPGLFVLGAALVFVFGSIASAICPDPTKSFLTLILWLAVMVGLPTVVATWGPGPRVVDLLVWCYVAGHLVSFGFALVHGASDQGRYGGLATHPNYFAQAGLITFCLLLYLFWRFPQAWVRAVTVGAVVVCGATIHLSGSRAAMVVAAVLVLMIPVVERSAIIGFLYALLGALVIVAIPLIVDVAGESSAIGRLVGGNASNLSDQARELGQRSGIERFLDQPFLGTGLIDLFDIHNMYLEIAAGIGLFGVIGFVMVLYVFARPLFSDVPHHRMLYVAWAFVGFGATVPGFYDRSIWLPLALGVVAVLEYARSTGELEAEPADPAGPAAGPADDPADDPAPPLASQQGATR